MGERHGVLGLFFLYGVVMHSMINVSVCFCVCVCVCMSVYVCV